MRKLLSVSFVLVLLLLLTGCNNRLLVRDTSIEDFAPIFREYIQLHGYELTYANDQTGAYRVFLGDVHIPERVITSSSSTTKFVSGNIEHEILTRHEENIYDTIRRQSQVVKQYVMVRVVESTEGVHVTISADDSYYRQPIASQGRSLERYLRDLGYQVEFI